MDDKAAKLSRQSGRYACCMSCAGANMGGKSTLLRSTCVAVIMAQLGCYVAASSAVMEPVDAIFTRIGEMVVRPEL
jgi:DNA mismatch repair protein MSH6